VRPLQAREEHYCDEGPTLTYAAKDRVDGSITMGGYSSNYVVDERFAHTFPPISTGRRRSAALRGHHHLLAAAPLEGRPGMKVGIVGLGGLGHMALKFAHSFGAHTVLFTTNIRKKEDAIGLGADEVVLSATPTR
jgi:uncharacterized zinc-type alcohol dehydrogenase-like protein